MLRAFLAGSFSSENNVNSWVLILSQLCIFVGATTLTFQDIFMHILTGFILCVLQLSLSTLGLQARCWGLKSLRWFKGRGNGIDWNDTNIETYIGIGSCILQPTSTQINHFQGIFGLCAFETHPHDQWRPSTNSTRINSFNGLALFGPERFPWNFNHKLPDKISRPT